MSRDAPESDALLRAIRRTLPDTVRLWHGGVPGLRVGDVLSGGHERAVRDDCPYCQARARGENTVTPLGKLDGPSQQSGVYVTTDRLYAKHYASLYGRGDLYRVEPLGELRPSTEDSYETYVADQARVVAVYDRAVLLTWTERRRLFREWGVADEKAATR